MRAEELPLTPAVGCIGWPSQGSAGGLTLVVQIREIWWADQLNYHRRPDSKMIHPKIYIMCEWLDFMKGPLLLDQSYRISMATKEQLGGASARIQY